MRIARTATALAPRSRARPTSSISLNGSAFSAAVGSRSSAPMCKAHRHIVADLHFVEPLRRSAHHDRLDVAERSFQRDLALGDIDRLNFRGPVTS